MKSAVIPQVRVEPELRAELEAVLRQGESLSEFVETSVRNAVEFRRVQARFGERGQAAWEHFQRTGVSVSADEVLNKLQAKLDARRKQLGG
jgi:vancomycin resistance protein YoaR